MAKQLRRKRKPKDATRELIKEAEALRGSAAKAPKGQSTRSVIRDAEDMLPRPAKSGTLTTLILTALVVAGLVAAATFYWPS